MKKRILSIILTVFMVTAIVSVMSTTATAADTCSCIAKCTDDYKDADCPVCNAGGYCSGRTPWPVSDTDALQNAMNISGQYPTLYFQLAEDITLTTNKITVPFGANAVLDLNGHTITAAEKNSNIFIVNGKLTLIDTKGGGTLKGAKDTTIDIRYKGDVLMKGGTILQEYSQCAVSIFQGRFEMTGGTIKVLVNGTYSVLTVDYNSTALIKGDARITIGAPQKFDIRNGTLYVDCSIDCGLRIWGDGTVDTTDSGEGAVIGGSILNYGTISGGRYAGEVDNRTFLDEGIAMSEGVINGGIFDGKVTNKTLISGGTFNSEVVNSGTISGGTFLGTVDSENGTIEDSAKVTVRFVNEAGETIKTVRVLRGQKIHSADVPDIETMQYGYRKVKYIVGGKEYRDKSSLADGVRYTADETLVTLVRTDPITYTITYNLNGGSLYYTQSEYQAITDDFTLGHPTKEGHVFKGWSGTDLEGSDNMTVTIPKGSTGNREYTACYMISPALSGDLSPISGYTVVFDTQGGSTVNPKEGVSKSFKVLEGVETPTKEGYKFLRWECGGSWIVLVDTTVERLISKADKGVITLTATWMEKPKAPYNSAVQKYTYDGTGKAFEIKDTTLDGFTVTYRKDGNAVAAPVTAGAYDVIVKREADDTYKEVNDTILGGLVIQPKDITVTIGAISDQTYTGRNIKPDVTVTDGTRELPASEYTIEYANNKNAGTATVTVKAKTGGNYLFTQTTVSFYIQKKLITPTVSMEDYVYGKNFDYPEVSGNDGGGDVSVYYSTYDDIAVNAGHRTLMDASLFSSTTLDAGTYYMMITVAESGNFTAGTSGAITFRVKADKYDTPSVPVLSGAAVTIGVADCGKKLEYSLDGGTWTDVPTLDNGSFVLPGITGNTGYDLSIRQKGSADGNYMASDAVSCFYVTYNENGGNGIVTAGAFGYDGNAVIVESGDTLQRTGYSFSRWNTAADGSGTAYAAGSSITKGATLYAQWTARPTGGNGSGSSSASTYPITVAQPAEGGTATVSNKNPKNGDKVTITPKPDEGYEVGEILVTDKNGETVKVTNNGDGTYSFIQPEGKVNVEIAFMEDNSMKDSFVDVPANAYYYDAVIWAAENGITGGTDDNHFSPNSPCTRAQIITFLWRAAGCPEPGTVSGFEDVPEDSYYAKAVAWAVEQGITTGTGDSMTFSPNATCTRAQAMAFIYRVEQAQGGGTQDADLFLNPFSDLDPEDYYYDAVMWAVANGITNGTGDTTFSPDADCTRAQIIVFLYRFFTGNLDF